MHARTEKKHKDRRIVQTNRIEKESLEEGDYYKTRGLRTHKSLGQQVHYESPLGDGQP